MAETEPEDLAGRIEEVLSTPEWALDRRGLRLEDAAWIRRRFEAIRDRCLSSRGDFNPMETWKAARVEWVRKVMAEANRAKEESS